MNNVVHPSETSLTVFQTYVPLTLQLRVFPKFYLDPLRTNTFSIPAKIFKFCFAITACYKAMLYTIQGDACLPFLRFTVFLYKLRLFCTLTTWFLLDCMHDRIYSCKDMRSHKPPRYAVLKYDRSDNGLVLTSRNW
jgi:hypothetical protein